MGHLKVEEAKEYTTSLLGIFSTKGEEEREKESELWLQSYITASAHTVNTYANYFHYKQRNRKFTILTLNYISCCHNLQIVANYEYLGNQPKKELENEFMVKLFII